MGFVLDLEETAGGEGVAVETGESVGGGVAGGAGFVFGGAQASGFLRNRSLRSRLVFLVSGYW